MLHWLVNHDSFDTLTNVRIYRESRAWNWKIDAKKESMMFKYFPKLLLKRMGKDKLGYHSHDWTVRANNYKTRPKLPEFFKILATDTHNGIEFVLAV